MKLSAAVLTLCFLFTATVPAAVASPHGKVKATRRKPYKVRRTKTHKVTVHKTGH